MNSQELYKTALAFAQKAHAGQKRKGNNEPYFNHVKRVSDAISEFSPIAKIAALLHDTVEDCGIEVVDIHDAFGEDIAAVVFLVTRQKDETYYEFIHRLTGDYDALLVKRADLKDNMADLSEGSLKDKYRFALDVVEAAIEEHLENS